jgi:hypothetical protein
MASILQRYGIINAAWVWQQCCGDMASKMRRYGINDADNNQIKPPYNQTQPAI